MAHLYLYLLYDRREPPPPPPHRDYSFSSRDLTFGRIPVPVDPVAGAVTELIITYRKTFDANVEILGQQPVDRLPDEPDTFVVSTCLMALGDRGVSFDKAQDEISYSTDWLGRQRIGTCRILIRSPQPTGRRPAVPSGDARVSLLDVGSSDKRTLVKEFHKLRDRYDLPRWNYADFGALFSATPSTLFEGVDPTWAESVKSQLQAAGAIVEVTRPVQPTSDPASTVAELAAAGMPLGSTDQGAFARGDVERRRHDPDALRLAIMVLIAAGVALGLVILAQFLG